MKNFRRFALLTTLATYMAIFIGGLVRVSGAGLGCPDWPKCFGRWFPPTNVNQLPEGIDPAHFNFTLAWIEYFNRLVGVVIGILILVTAILAIKHYRKIKRIIYPSLAAFLLVCYTGWQGGQVVESGLRPLFVSIHMVLALVIAGLLIYVTQQSYYLENPQAERGTVFPGKAHLWITMLGVVGIIQVILGTQVREGLEMIRQRMPLISAAEFRNYIGIVNYAHAAIGVLLALGTVLAGYIILDKSRNLPALVKESIWGLLVLITAQLLVGLLLVTAGVPALMQLFHLWLASLYVGVIFVLYSAFRKHTEGKSDVIKA